MWLILTALVGMLTVASCQRTTGDVSSSDTEAVLQNILQRKSVRSYRSDMPVEKEKVENLLRAGMAAPSGKDKRPWEFIVVDERELLDSLAAHLPYAKMLTSAPMAIVVCADETKSDYWYLDCSAAAENMLLAAEAQGLGAVWSYLSISGTDGSGIAFPAYAFAGEVALCHTGRISYGRAGTEG